MKTNLVCPVCSRQEIEGDICPNCETNLSLVRMLTELPPQPQTTALPPQPQPIWLIVCLILGLLVGLIAWLNTAYVKTEVVSTPSSAMIKNESIQARERASERVSVAEDEQENPEKYCGGGFYYKVIGGDSLSMMALNFYGDANLWPMIAQVNPIMEKQNNLLEIGQVLLVPNLEENCYEFFQ